MEQSTKELINYIASDDPACDECIYCGEPSERK